MHKAVPSTAVVHGLTVGGRLRHGPRPGVVPVRAKDRVGGYGEDVAARALVDAGMTLLARNWRCDAGEIDIVARDGDALVVCEVKTRSSLRYGSPLEAVTPAKAARLRRLAVRWLEAHDVHPPEIRFDVVGIVRSARGAASVEHVRGVL